MSTRMPAAEPLDANTVERLLAGMDPDDAPPGYAPVAAILRAAAQPPTDDEMRMSDALAARIAAALECKETPVESLTRRRSFKASTAIATAGLLIAGTMATAGALPTPAQRLASAAFEEIGIHVPSPDDDGTTPPDTTPYAPTSNTTNNHDLDDPQSDSLTPPAGIAPDDGAAAPTTDDDPLAATSDQDESSTDTRTRGNDNDDDATDVTAPADDSTDVDDGGSLVSNESDDADDQGVQEPAGEQSVDAPSAPTAPHEDENGSANQGAQE